MGIHFKLIKFNSIQLIYFLKTLLTIRECVMYGMWQADYKFAVISLPMLYMVALWWQGVIAI
jgi:hypothetical protein